MRESCSWEGNTYAKYIFNPHRSWRDGSGSPTGTRIVDKAYAAKRLLDSIYGIRNFLWYAIFDLSLTSHDICRFGQLICEYSTIRLEWPVAFRSASLLAGSFAQT